MEATLAASHGSDSGCRRGMSAFGLGLLTDLTPPGAWNSHQLPEPLLRLRSVERAVIEECWSGTEAIGWQGAADGARLVVERGRAGDHRFLYRDDVHLLSSDSSLLRCAPAQPEEPSWWRVVLDSVLFTAALLRGYEALHAGAVATDRGVIAITATTGGGKSTLVSELLGRGFELMADDVLVLESLATGGPPLAHPAPPLMTVPKVRLTGFGEAGESIACFGDEHWIPVSVHRGPLPLSALVVLNRSPSLRKGIRRARSPLATLLGALLRFPRTPKRERACFEIAGEIAANVPVWELDADPGVDPAALVTLLLATIAAPGTT